MTDHGKPIGWWCNTCQHMFGPTSMHALGAGGNNIPVFAVIPEGERPSTHEPRKDDVCTSLNIEWNTPMYHRRTYIPLERGSAVSSHLGGEGFAALVTAEDLS